MNDNAKKLLEKVKIKIPISVLFWWLRDRWRRGKAPRVPAGRPPRPKG